VTHIEHFAVARDVHDFGVGPQRDRLLAALTRAYREIEHGVGGTLADTEHELARSIARVEPSAASGLLIRSVNVSPAADGIRNGGSRSVRAGVRGHRHGARFDMQIGLAVTLQTSARSVSTGAVSVSVSLHVERAGPTRGSFAVAIAAVCARFDLPCRKSTRARGERRTDTVNPRLLAQALRTCVEIDQLRPSVISRCTRTNGANCARRQRRRIPHSRVRAPAKRFGQQRFR